MKILLLAPILNTFFSAACEAVVIQVPRQAQTTLLYCDRIHIY